MPFVPGVLALSAASSRSVGAAIGGLIGVALVFTFVWRLNLRGATWLDGELQKVEALEGQL
jgi:hypothetical protein